MSRDGNILVHPSGRLSSDDLDLPGWLEPRAGLWRPVPAPPELIILERVERAEGQGQVALSGRITAPGDLTDVLQMLDSGRWEGLFNVLTDTTRKTLFVKQGAIVGAVSSAPQDRIGEMLVRLGVITDDQLHKALADSGGPRRLGAVLVQGGFITPADLYSALKTQVEEIFYSLLLLTEGSYWFLKQALDRPAWGQLRLPTSGLLLEGVQRIDEMSYFREKIPSSRVVFEPVEPPPRVTLDQTEMAVLRFVDGELTLEDIARAARITEYVATRAAFRLLQAGLIKQGTRTLGRRGAAARKAGAAEIVEVVNGVLGRVADEARKVGRERALRQAPSTFYSAATPHSLLFERVELDHSGRLEAELLLDNLVQAEAENPSEFMYDALSDFLSYAVFLVCEGLPNESAADLRDRIGSILREEGMEEALGSP